MIGVLLRLPYRSSAECPFGRHSPTGGALVRPTRSLTAVVRVQLVNGRTLWMQNLAEDDDDHEEWLRGTNSRGRDVLLSRARVKAVRPN
jgi:hypothetical protein